MRKRLTKSFSTSMIIFKKRANMKYLFYIFFVFISVNTFSQSDNPCEVDGVEVLASMFYFEPQNISVNLGQTVYWLNIQGFHDVNAVNNTLTNEPFNNPEPFSLDAIQGNSSGVCIGYHTFNVPGIYNYDCSIYGHALNGMVGTIEVGIGGCTDQSADNYDDNAEYDNGTCCYIGELSTDILPALCSDDIASLNILSSNSYNLNYEVLNFELSNTTGQFDLDDLLSQIRQMKKMGGISGMMKFIPGLGNLTNKISQNSNPDNSMAQQEAIILSMTKYERSRPKIINGSRKKRIASGSGTDISLVNKLLKQHKMMSNMMKKMSKGGNTELSNLKGIPPELLNNLK